MNPSSINPVLTALCLLPLGIAIKMSLRLLYGARGPSEGDSLHHAMNVTAWVLIITGLCPAYFSILVIPIFLLAVLETVLAQRAHSKGMAWSLVCQAMAHGHSLKEFAALGRQRLSGSVRREFQRFANDLHNGIDTVDAIGRHPEAFPRDVQGQAALAKSGAIPLFANATSVATDAQTGWSATVHRMIYLFYSIKVMILIMTFYWIKIVPEFKKIFEEFALDLPPITQFFFQTIEVFTNSGIGSMLFLLFFFFGAGMVICWLGYLLGFPLLQPLTDRFMFARHRAEVLQLLAVTAEQQVPFETAFANLSSGRPRYGSEVVANRLRRVARFTEQGIDWQSALVKTHLLKKNEVPLLQAASQAGNLPWALRAVADRSISRSFFRWQALQQVLFPVVTLAFGSLVMWMAIALFYPLVALIESLA